LTGPGTGLTFVTCSIAALTGIDEREAGLASGLSNTTFQIGAAIGTAVVSTVAVSRTSDFVAANGAGDRLVALTEGFQSAFLVCIAFAAAALLCTVLLGRRATAQPLEPMPEPAAE
jgi:hypothetical protein